MSQPLFFELKVYQAAEQLADAVNGAVRRWDPYPRNTVGVPLLRALDGIGAAIAAGYARGMGRADRRAVRAAFYEALFWLRRAAKRKFLNEPQVEQLQPAVDDLAAGLRAFLDRAARARRRRPGDTPS